MNKQKSISSKDVARRAGVSQATVSYVLNNVEGISIKPETREAVLKAAKELNYHPDLIARSMRIKKSMSVGIVTDKDLSSHVFMNILEGIKDALIPRNYTMTMCLNKSQDDNDADYIRYFNSKWIDAVIFVYANLTQSQIEYLKDNNIPFVVIDTNARDEVMHLVNTDMTGAISKAINQLAAKGISKIGYLGFGAGNRSSRRYMGYLKGLEDNNIIFDENTVYRISKLDDCLDKEFDQYVKRCSSKPWAVFCDRINLSFKFLKYAAQNGIKIPEDMAVVGIGTSKFSNDSYPSLSAIEAPLYDIGYSACNMLFDIMKGKPVKDVMMLQWQFVPRDST